MAIKFQLLPYEAICRARDVLRRCGTPVDAELIHSIAAELLVQNRSGMVAALKDFQERATALSFSTQAEAGLHEARVPHGEDLAVMAKRAAEAEQQRARTPAKRPKKQPKDLARKTR